MPDEVERSPAGTQAVRKAVALLKAFSHDQPELSVAELSRRLGIHKSTVSRLLGALELEGLVERNADTGRYRLGTELIVLAGQVVGHADLRLLAKPYLDALASRRGETTNLVILYHDSALNIEQSVPAERQIKDIGWVGKRTPLHATSPGKVLLAFLPAGERAAVLARLRLERYTSCTITEREVLERELAEVCRRGFATAQEELEVGLNSAAAPVWDQTGRVCAAVSLSGPAYRVTPEQLPAIGEELRDAGMQISRRLGYVPADTSSRTKL